MIFHHLIIQKKISIHILRKNFFYKCHHNNKEAFSPNVINFCHPSAICYIPFKIICVIGADHLSIPKINHYDNFNLLKKYPLIEDTNIYEKYSYLFVQSISCAEKYFYISYIGYSIKDQSKIYPSVLVDQLLNYIALNFCFIGDRNLNLADNTKKIIKYICTTYTEEHFYEKTNINTLTRKNLSNLPKIIEKKIYEKNLLKEKSYNQINLKNLINFWKNPIRYFFNFNLNIQLKKKQKINRTEPFSVNQLDSFNIKNVLLNAMINNQDTMKLFQYYTLSGKLPYHFFGKIFWNKNVEEMQSIVKKVIKYKNSTKEKKINLNVEKYQINGILSEIQNTGLLRWKPTAINYSDRIALWLEHLIYSLLGGFKESRIIGYKGQIWSFSSLNSNKAQIYLLQYIEGYINGIKEPLLLTKSGASWLDKVYDIKNDFITKDYPKKRKGYKKFLETWIGNDYIEGEKEDFYIKQIITKLNKNKIEKTCKTAEKWLIPILKHKKLK